MGVWWWCPALVLPAPGRWGHFLGMYSFCQLMTASMPTFIGRNITAIRPTHDCFYANLGHIMTAFMPTIGQIVWLQKVNLSLLFCQLYLTSWWYHCLHANSSWIIYLLWTHLLILNHLAGLLDTNSNDHTASDKNSLLLDHEDSCPICAEDIEAILQVMT